MLIFIIKNINSFINTEQNYFRAGKTLWVTGVTVTLCHKPGSHVTHVTNRTFPPNLWREFAPLLSSAAAPVMLLEYRGLNYMAELKSTAECSCASSVTMCDSHKVLHILQIYWSICPCQITIVDHMYATTNYKYLKMSPYLLNICLMAKM